MSLTEYERLPVASQKRLDDVCRRFEKTWAAPSADALAAFLQSAPENERPVWLAELLHIEIENARKAGTPVAASEYRDRLPALSEPIDAVFAEHPPAIGVGSSVGKYRLTRLIGRGGSGIVYEAEDPVIGRRVAVKLLAGRPNAARVVEEARLVGRLQHPNIVTVHDAGSADGVWYMAMELLAGSAADRIKADGPFAPAEATRIAADVCRGMAAAHAAGLVHRDIKPANVLLASPGDGDGPPVAKLSDFGLAQTRDGPDAGETTAGTLQYMAPEQFDGGPAGPACDIYSLGATYYALLTGRSPRVSTPDRLGKRGSNPDPAPPPAPVHRGVTAGHRRVLTRAMAPTPSDRYRTAADMLAELEALAAAPPARAARPVRSALAGCGAALAVAALAVAAPSEWLPPMPRWGGITSAPTEATGDGWTPLFNGRDLAGWTTSLGRQAAGDGQAPAIRVVQDRGGPAIRFGGDADGTLTTEREFESFHLRLELLRSGPGDSFSGGLRYHANGSRAGDPDSGSWDELSFASKDFGGYRHSPDRAGRAAEFRQGRLSTIEPADADSLPKPAPALAAGKWHVVELVCWKNIAVHVVNGSVVATILGPDATPAAGTSRGRIQVRAGTGPTLLRNLQIRTVAGIPAEFQDRHR